MVANRKYLINQVLIAQSDYTMIKGWKNGKNKKDKKGKICEGQLFKEVSYATTYARRITLNHAICMCDVIISQ